MFMVELDPNQASQFGMVERSASARNLADSGTKIESKKEELSSDKEVESKLFSLTIRQVRKLLNLAKEDHPAQVYRLAIWLTILKRGLTAKQLSNLTKIPLSSVYRTLHGNSVFRSTGRPARVSMDLQDSHQ